MLLFIYLGAFTLAQSCVSDGPIPPGASQAPLYSGFPLIPDLLPRLPWIFPWNASQTITLPVQNTDFSLGSRSDCPHLDASLKRWEENSVWGGVAPTSGDVTIPEGVSVLLSGCAFSNGSAAFKTIKIPATSKLVLDDSDLNLAATSIIVQGALIAGSPTCRLRGAINITLVGRRPTPLHLVSTTSDPYLKGIVVEDSGVLDLHGERYTPTWTRLGSTALSGDTWLFLQQPVNWEIGQRVIVTTTALKDSRDYSETEIITIHHIFTLPSGLTAIHFLQPLQFTHYAGVEYQAEVGLLSRRLMVAGGETDSDPTDTEPAMCPAPPDASQYFNKGLPCHNSSLTGFGGHIMVVGPQAAGRLSGVLLLRMGQTNYLARYPFHLHMLNSSGVNSFIQDSTIWKSFYRCVSIHGTSFSRIANNVAHDAIGHCYYLEDGVEEQNTFENNLASLVHPLFGGEDNFFPVSGPGQSQEFPKSLSVSPTLLLPADSTASGFYITNKFNKFIGNAASGGWSGFAFPGLRTPIGEHRFSRLAAPVARPTLIFRGNSAHSSGYYWSAGGCLYVGGFLGFSPGFPSNASLVYNPGRANTFNPSGVSISHALSVFNDTKLFLCNGVGLQHWGNNPMIYGLEIFDVGGKGINFFGNAYLERWLMQCRTPNNPTIASRGATGYQERSFMRSASIFQSYDTGQSHILNRVTFRNCSSNPKQKFFLNQMLTHSDQFTPDSMIITKNFVFESSGDASSAERLGVTINASFPTVSHRMQNWGDADGSLSGRGVPTALGSSRQGWWWRLDKACVNRMDWTMWVCDDLPGRGSGMIYFLINATLQNTPLLGTQVCSNGNYLSVPCPTLGRVWHLGHTPAEGMDLPLNAKLSGPTGGFGWVVGGAQWRAPVTLNLTNPQAPSGTKQMLVLPYPPRSKFYITAISQNSQGFLQTQSVLPNSCYVLDKAGKRLADNMCAWNFSAVKSVAEVRNGLGDTYFFDESTNHLYLNFFPISSYSTVGVPNISTLGVRGLGRVWGPPDPGFSGWTQGGVSLPPRGVNVIRIITDCGSGGLDSTGLYCDTFAGNGGTLPSSPCPPGVSLPLDSFDSCGFSGSTGTTGTGGTGSGSDGSSGGGANGVKGAVGIIGIVLGCLAVLFCGLFALRCWCLSKRMSLQPSKPLRSLSQNKLPLQRSASQQFRVANILTSAQ